MRIYQHIFIEETQVLAEQLGQDSYSSLQETAKEINQCTTPVICIIVPELF